MKRIIRQLLKQPDASDGIKGTKLKKLVLKELQEDESVKNEDFDECLALLMKKGTITIDDLGKIRLLKSTEKKSKKRKDYDDNDADNVEYESKKHKSQETKASNGQNQKSKYFEDLWKNGEKYYREGTLDAEYVRTNPDGITRLFCGNLNRNVTEEQLRTCIEGVTHIKWITDKATQAFYGSTFLEMRDPKAAITAVLQDVSYNSFH